MDERDWLAERFEENRPHLRAVAYRMLGSLAEADDAVQKAPPQPLRHGRDRERGSSRSTSSPTPSGSPGSTLPCRAATRSEWARADW